MYRILIVDDDVAFCTMLTTFLKKNDFAVASAFTVSEATEKLLADRFDLILTDVRLPDKDGISILYEVQRKRIKTVVILMTGYAEINKAVQAIKQGAYDYIAKPFTPDAILETIQKALDAKFPFSRSKEESQSSKLEAKDSDATAFYFIKGVSNASKKLIEYVALVAPTTMSVLITGASGTGKEYIAKSIHRASKRCDKPFVAVDCGAIPKELATSEFFGHVKGSFTGAIQDKIGHFEAANCGTLFLDEIGNLTYDLQVHLLRALQERKIKPVGSNKEIKVDIRVIVATNEDLEKAVQQGEFREDLFHRVNEFLIKVPPLNQRVADLLLFANHFMEEANQSLEKQVIGFTEEVLEIFKAYHWPGNLRELKNVVKRSVLLSQGKMITIKEVPEKLITTSNSSFNLFKNKNEKEYIINALKKTHGNKAKAARLLDIDRKTLYNKIKQYDIEL